MTDAAVQEVMQAMQQVEAKIEAYGGFDKWEADGGVMLGELNMLVSNRLDAGTLTNEQAYKAGDLLNKLKQILTPGMDD